MTGWLRRLFSGDPPHPEKNFELPVARVRSHEEYLRHAARQEESERDWYLFELSLIPETATEFSYPGHCYVCRRPVDFRVDFDYASEMDGRRVPNWRERLICPGCRLNNRMRATLHILEQEFQPQPDSTLYITEQVTPLYAWLRRSFARLEGSEYLGESTLFGSCDRRGIRNEDLTRLSFDENQFDYILSFDVLEHIPGYRQALSECHRCLKPGGVFYFSVPFLKTSRKNLVRARLGERGEVVHLLPPEYHGDPLAPQGCLCYYHFGWEMLDELRATGFQEAVALLYWSRDFGYLGGEQILFAATKGG